MPLFVGKVVNLRFDHAPQLLWRGESDLLQRYPELPFSAFLEHEALLGHVVEHRHNEQGIALRVVIDQLGQALWNLTRPLRREIFSDFRFAHRLQSDLATEPM